MVFYDLIAPAYDLAFRRIYAPFRKRALDHLQIRPGSSVLDVACGTGQNFPLLNAKVGLKGKIIGVDVSRGMLRKAKGFIHRSGYADISLLHLDAAGLSHTLLKQQTGFSEVDAVVCTYAFTTMKNWEIAFHRSYNMLKPGGVYLIHDIHAEKRTFHSAFVEKVTRTNLARKSWLPLERLSSNFHFEYLDPFSHIFGGRLFVAFGTKH